ncbi:NOL1/NOP2/Sun family protein [Cavenderia fasciculata]|uniref:NOL1/NOP2/Sun family protein n=1 Tax=Cavenderia fasciculata TaxID=261658 RepID=F4Q0K1_CACFS|nr:NOL1/NOP2/Sun family protein [Cavenderia fasciculata]EGG18352.1 NOL1/NOP2/Sun family protein [Cavenderia fasciculata]|eukprot:XP_004366256.1 NOL1/NOP2/Sun family protein [Cavenderia fasciculata]
MADYYIQASNIIEKLLQKKGSIKGLAFANSSSSNDSKNKTAYALVCETLKYKDIIDELITTIPNIKKEKNLKYGIMLVMIYDLLFSTAKDIRGGGFAKKIVIGYKTQLNSSLARLKIKKQVSSNTGLLPESIRNPLVLPRYVRINTLAKKTQQTDEQFIQQIIQKFKDRGFILKDGNTYQSKLDFSNDKFFYQDNDFKEIIIFTSAIDLHDDELLTTGQIILQDKASCLPSYILAPPPGATVIDSCSAPGNKTSLLSALMGNTGRIYAIEKDKKRCGTLIKLTTRSQCKNITAINDSFLECSWDDPKFKDVEYILCDPSCSGSGIVNRLDHLLGNHFATDEADDVEDLIKENLKNNPNPNQNNNSFQKKKQQNSNNKKGPMGFEEREVKKLEKLNEKFGMTNNSALKQQQQKLEKEQQEKEQAQENEARDNQNRLQTLADFQLSIIKHAFGFPNVKKVAYSTCSIHQTENEDVVFRALKYLNAKKPTWKLVKILPNWNKSRGFAGMYPTSDYSIRTAPEVDNTIGFFVALFEKIPSTPGDEIDKVIEQLAKDKQDKDLKRKFDQDEEEQVEDEEQEDEEEEEEEDDSEEEEMKKPITKSQPIIASAVPTGGFVSLFSGFKDDTRLGERYDPAAPGTKVKSKNILSNQEFTTDSEDELEFEGDVPKVSEKADKKGKKKGKPEKKPNQQNNNNKVKVKKLGSKFKKQKK